MLLHNFVTAKITLIECIIVVVYMWYITYIIYDICVYCILYTVKYIYIYIYIYNSTIVIDTNVSATLRTSYIIVMNNYY